MNTDLKKISIEKMRSITIDNETLEILEELIGVQGSCYDWWELSQGLKDILIGIYLLRKR